MRTLKKGAQGEDVRALQEMLNQLGYNAGTADGIFGAKTEAAVKRLQADFNLAVDGIAGPATLELLAARSADPDAPEIPEDDGQDLPDDTVRISRADAMEIRDALRQALSAIEAAMK